MLIMNKSIGELLTNSVPFGMFVRFDMKILQGTHTSSISSVAKLQLTVSLILFYMLTATSPLFQLIQSMLECQLHLRMKISVSPRNNLSFMSLIVRMSCLPELMDLKTLTKVRF